MKSSHRLWRHILECHPPKCLRCWMNTVVLNLQGRMSECSWGGNLAPATASTSGSNWPPSAGGAQVNAKPWNHRSMHSFSRGWKARPAYRWYSPIIIMTPKQSSSWMGPTSIKSYWHGSHPWPPLWSMRKSTCSRVLRVLMILTHHWVGKILNLSVAHSVSTMKPNTQSLKPLTMIHLWSGMFLSMKALSIRSPLLTIRPTIWSV